MFSVSFLHFQLNSQGIIASAALLRSPFASFRASLPTLPSPRVECVRQEKRRWQKPGRRPAGVDTTEIKSIWCDASDSQGDKGRGWGQHKKQRWLSGKNPLIGQLARAALWTADVAGDGRGAWLRGLKGTQVALHVSLQRWKKSSLSGLGWCNPCLSRLLCTSTHTQRRTASCRCGAWCDPASHLAQQPKWAHSNGNQQSFCEWQTVFEFNTKGK